MADVKNLNYGDRIPVITRDISNMTSKYVKYCGRVYCIFYDCKQERRPDGNIFNTLTIVSVDGFDIKPFAISWEGDSDSVITKTQKLVLQYLNSSKCKLTPEQEFVKWDGDLDEYTKYD